MNPLAWLRLGVAAAVAALLLWAGAIVIGWKHDSEKLEKAWLERDQARADLALRDEQFRDAQEASRGYQSELQNLRASSARRADISVRVCKLPGSSRPEPIPTSESRPLEASAAAGVLQQDTAVQVGPEIGPDLSADAADADDILALARALQIYGKTCAGVQ